LERRKSSPPSHKWRTSSLEKRPEIRYRRGVLCKGILD